MHSSSDARSLIGTPRASRANRQPIFDSPFARALFLALAVAGPLAGGAPLAGQPADLRVRQVSPEGGANADVLGQQSLRAVSPDGKWVVFHADVETDNEPDVYSARRFGGVPVRLSAVRPSGSDDVMAPRITPDSRRVIFLIDQETIHRQEVWSVPIEGPATAAIKLSPPTPLGAEALSFPELSGDAARVAFTFGVSGGQRELWSAPVDGSAPALRLSPDLPPGATGVADARYTADRVVFTGDLTAAGRFELWSVPFDGSASATRISGSLQAGGDVGVFTPSADGQRILYSADQRFEAVDELFSVPVTGPFSAAVRVSPDLVAGGDVSEIQFSTDGTRALFLADAIVDGRVELWSAPIEGPAAAAIQLNPPLVAGGAVQSLFNEHGGMVAYRADQNVDELFEAFLVPAVGPSTAAIPLAGSIVAGGDVTGVAIIPVEDETFVIATGDLRQDEKVEFHTAPGDGSANLGPIFSTIPAGLDFAGDCPGAIAGQVLFFCGEPTTALVIDLYSVPMDRSTDPVLLSSGADLATSDVTELAVDPTGTWVVFRWDRDVDERHDLFRRRTDGSGVPERIHAVPVPAGADVFEDDGGYTFTPDGYGVFYFADHEVDEKLELWLADGMVFRADFEWGGTEEWSE